VQQLYSEYKSTGVIHVQKKVGRHKRLFLRALGMKSLSCTENTELAQAISAKYFRAKDYILTMTESTKSSRRLDLQ